MDEEHRKQRRRLWIILASVALTPVLLLGLYVILNHNGVARRLKALRDAGHPTDLTEWAKAHKLPEGTPNAAKIYEQAFSQFVYPTNDGNVPVLGQADWPERGAMWSEPMLRDVAQCLQDNQACLDSFHEAAAIDQCRYNWQYIPSFPEFSDLRYGIRLLELEMLFRAQQGDAAGAISSFEGIVGLSHSIQYEPTLIVYLVRIACLSLVPRGLQWSLNTTSFTDLQLCELDRMLAETVETPGLTEAMISERCWAIETFRDPSQVANNMIGSGGFVVRLPGAMTTGLMDTLDYIAAIIEALKLPPIERLARLSEIDTEQEDLSFWHFVSKQSLPTLGRMGVLDLRLQTEIVLARTALAIERFRLTTGEVPGRLEMLVPAYLDAVPIDPFDGQPIRYRSTEPGYLLYSIMEDGQDNGGVERDKKDRDAPYDMCFIVTR